jgi:Concanavalin A-like lectin/glucanases superfamily
MGNPLMRVTSYALLIRRNTLLAVLLSLAAVQTAMPAVLTHRYSFDIDASDSVNHANGVLQGHAFIANGALVLDGTNSSMRLPHDLFSNYGSISFEVWYSDCPVSSPNGQLYNFSGKNGGMNYFLFGRAKCFAGLNSIDVSLPIPAVGGTNHLVWTQGSAIARIYINGALAAQSAPNVGFTPAKIGSTTNNLIGAGTNNVVTSVFKGSILEFRMYRGDLAPLDVAVLDAFGPDQPQLNPGTLQSVRVVIPSPTGPGALFRAAVFADFSSVSNVNISTQPDLILASNNTNVVTFTKDGRLRTVAAGTADISAVWQGFSNKVTVTVGAPQDIALVHRYSFNEQTNDWIVHDSVGGANGRLFNTGSSSSVVNGAFTGKGEMNLHGSLQSLNTSSGYAALPPGIISSLSEVSVEAWVTWTFPAPQFGLPAAWQRIFDFGSSNPATNGGWGYSYLFLTPATDSYYVTTKPLLHFAITTNYNETETPRLNWTNSLPLNVTSFVAVTYSPVRGVAKLYLNGALIASDAATIPLSGIIDTNNWLGRSQFSSDAYFGGSYNEFRIYAGLLSDSDIAADYAAGPDTVGVDFVLHDFAGSNSLIITWGPSATNLVLQSSPVLGVGAAWNQVPPVPILQSGRYSVNVPLTGDTAFFRLHTP